MDPRITSILAADLESLTSKVLSCLDESDPRRALIAGNLATCSYLLIGSDDVGSDDDAEGPATSDPARPPRDLRREMAGPLPPSGGPADHRDIVGPARRDQRPRSRPARRRAAPFREVPAPTIGQYEEIAGEPGDLCECGGPFEAHPIDRALPRRGDTVARVLCDQTRAWVYSRASQNGV